MLAIRCSFSGKCIICRKMTLMICVFSFFILNSCSDAGPGVNSESMSRILALLQTQEEDWNKGDVDAFMLGYWNSDSLRFYNGGGMTYGWQQTLDNYKRRYPGLESMGKLHFDIDDIQILNSDIANVMGRYHLIRTDDELRGYFNLVLRQIGGDWKIISDMTCAN